jgi:hypothetical protein
MSYPYSDTHTFGIGRQIKWKKENDYATSQISTKKNYISYPFIIYSNMFFVHDTAVIKALTSAINTLSHMIQ